MSTLPRSRRIFSGLYYGGPVRECPLCSFPLCNSKMGVRAHLRGHVHRHELAQDAVRDLTYRILQRTEREAIRRVT